MAQNIRLLEELIFNSVPARQTVLLDGWAIRLNGGYRYRCNCVWPLTKGFGPGTAEKIKLCEELLERNGMPAVFRITGSLDGRLAEALEKIGYEKIKTVSVMTLTVPEGRVQRPDYIELASEPSEEWLAESAALAGLRDERIARLHRAGIRKLAVDRVFASAKVDGKLVGCGYGTVERGCVGIFGVAVAPEYRCRGVGSAICRAVVAYGAENGAGTAYLMVNSRNVNAVALYGHMGFQKAYEYCFYRRPTADDRIFD
jgi:GNAT superfamily N-acetyltransferase